jgi:hypothetical protein
VLEKNDDEDTARMIAWKNVKDKYKKINDKWVSKANTMTHFNARTSGKLRYERHEGKQYVVAPVIAITEGVHSGSMGPAFYSAEELGRFVESWNGCPLPVGHPEDDKGNHISCQTPELIEKQSVGRFWNAKMEDKKLKGEIWVDVEKAKHIAPEVLNILTGGSEYLEVSTALWSDDSPQIGRWQESYFDAVVKNIRPDHIALLPHGKGACSVADGCGAPRINTNLQINDVTLNNVNDEAKKTFFTKLFDALKSLNFNLGGESKMTKAEKITALISNELTTFVEDDREWLNTLDECKLDKMVPVAPKANTDPDPNDAKKKEEDEKKVKEAELKANAEKAEKERAEAQAKAEKEASEKLAAQKGKPQTADEFIANAPKEIKEVLGTGLTLHRTQRDEVIKQLTANARNSFTEDELKSKTLDELKKLAELANVPIDFTANGAPVKSNKDDDKYASPMPEWDYEKNCVAEVK